MLDQRLHGGIEAIALPQLNGNAFCEIACAHTGWIETLQDSQHRLDLGERRTKLLGRLGQVLGQIASLVDQVDQVPPDHAADRIDNCERQLLGEMIDQRDLGRHEGFQVIVRIGTRTGTDASPFGLRWHIVSAGMPAFAIIGIGGGAFGRLEFLASGTTLT